MRSLGRFTSGIVATLFVVAMLFPVAGPVIDHHFAERQPGHLHLGLAGLTFPNTHSHIFSSEYHHAVMLSDVAGRTTAIYRHDSATVAAPAIAVADATLASMLSFEPSSVFVFPINTERIAVQHFYAPSGQPPPFLL
jgi:hypothetical protein